METLGPFEASTFSPFGPQTCASITSPTWCLHASHASGRPRACWMAMQPAVRWPGETSQESFSFIWMVMSAYLKTFIVIRFFFNINNNLRIFANYDVSLRYVAFSDISLNNIFIQVLHLTLPVLLAVVSKHMPRTESQQFHCCSRPTVASAISLPTASPSCSGGRAGTPRSFVPLSPERSTGSRSAVLPPSNVVMSFPSQWTTLTTSGFHDSWSFLVILQAFWILYLKIK